jgi:hypothetical protein
MKTSAIEKKIWAAKKNRVSVVGTVNFLVWYVNNDCVVVVDVGGGSEDTGSRFLHNIGQFPPN